MAKIFVLVEHRRGSIRAAPFECVRSAASFGRPRASCGRVQIDLGGLTKEVEKRLEALNIQRTLNVAVMGCAVNGPGEARGADIGIAGGNGVGILIKKGQIVRKVKESELADVLIEEVQRLGAQPTDN